MWHSLQDKLDRAHLAETTVSAWQVAHRPRAVNADATGVLLVAHARRSPRSPAGDVEGGEEITCTST